MDCFQDFCLTCDKQSDGPYCSQQCRLADLERAEPSASTPESPICRTTTSHEPVSWTRSEPGSGSAFVLPPAYNFTSQPSEQRRSLSTSPKPENRSQTSYFTPSALQRAKTDPSSPRVLSPSSSRTSLTSSISSSSNHSRNGLTDQARLELHEYFSSFDQTREAKRRSSLR